MSDHIAHRNLCIEDIDLVLWYAISINPDDSHQYMTEKEYTKRLKLFVDNQKIILNRILQPLKYELYLEVSPVGRLHWHGYIKYNNIETLKRFYLTQVIKLKHISTFEIDTMNGKWDAYVVKQYKIWDTKITSEDRINKLALMDVESEVIYKKIPLQ